MIASKLIALLCLGAIFYFDLRFRAVYWIVFPILSISFALMKKMQVGTYITLVDAGYDLFFLSVQLFFLWVYFSLKDKNCYNIVNRKLGLGDILFLVSVVFYLSPLNYVGFYITSLILTLCYVGVVNLLKKNVVEIPLAGLQAICLAILLISEWCFTHFSLYQDVWAYNTLLATS